VDSKFQLVKKNFSNSKLTLNFFEFSSVARANSRESKVADVAAIYTAVAVINAVLLLLQQQRRQ